jgi:hypothetical protein
MRIKQQDSPYSWIGREFRGAIGVDLIDRGYQRVGESFGIEEVIEGKPRTNQRDCETPAGRIVLSVDLRI